MEEIAVDCSRLSDCEVIEAALRLIATANYDTELPVPVRKFFGSLARSMSDLISWREAELERIELALREVPDE